MHWLVAEPRACRKSDNNFLSVGKWKSRVAFKPVKNVFLHLRNCLIRYLIRPTSFPQFSKILHCRMTEIAQTLNIKALISSMFPNHFHNNGQRLALLIEMALQYKFKAAWSWRLTVLKVLNRAIQKYHQSVIVPAILYYNTRYPSNNLRLSTDISLPTVLLCYLFINSP